MQLDITDDGFLSLMSDDGGTKDDVKVPEGEAGDKINKLFTDEGKDTSKLDWTTFVQCWPNDTPRRYCPHCHGRRVCYRCQGGSKGLEGPYTRCIATGGANLALCQTVVTT